MALARVKRGHDKCPYCQSCLHQRLQRKWLLIEARKCAFCGLIFRYPTDAAEAAASFYEGEYEGQHATDVPGAQEVERLTADNFAGTPYDKSHRIEVIYSVRPGGRILDFGCSWGYSLYQLKRAGYDPVGFELARNRAEAGRRLLGVEIRSDWESLLEDYRGRFDIIYTDHALEHLTDLRRPLENFSALLKPSGLLVIFVPNAGSLIGRRLGVRWKAFIGEAHTIGFADTWYVENLPRHGLSVEKIFSAGGGHESLRDGEELVCIARRDGYQTAGGEAS
jgi:SAM-dependent methyltransferase